jgi:HSP20 family protein
MKKITKSFLAMSLLATILSADQMPANQNLNDDFKRMNEYINSMIASHMNTNYFNDVSFPKVNMSENKENYVLKFDLAGIGKDEIKLSIDENNILTVEGERKSEKEEKDKSYVKQEIYYGKFKRSVKLPENADQDKLDTKYDNGILTVTVGKKKVTKPAAKIIKIK